MHPSNVNKTYETKVYHGISLLHTTSEEVSEVLWNNRVQLVSSYGHSWAACCLHFQAINSPWSHWLHTLEVHTACSSGRLVTTYRLTWRNIPNTRSSSTLPRGPLISRNWVLLFSFILRCNNDLVTIFVNRNVACTRKTVKTNIQTSIIMTEMLGH